MPAVPQSPRVSVLVTAYQAEAHLATALRSVLAQSLSDIEIVVVDNGSTDGTRAVLRRFAAQDRRVRMVHLPVNRGPGGGRNAGLAECRGTWITFLDADDAYAPNRLENLVKEAARSGYEMVADLLRLVDYPAMRPIPTSPVPDRLPEGGMVTAVDFVRSGDFSSNGYGYGYLKPLIRRELIERHAIRYAPELQICEDYHFYLDCLLQGARWRLLPLALYDYAVRQGSASRTVGPAVLDAVIVRSAAQLHLRGLDEQVRRAIAHRHRNLVHARAQAAFVEKLREQRFLDAAELLARSPAIAPRLARGAINRLLGPLTTG